MKYLYEKKCFDINKYKTKGAVASQDWINDYREERGCFTRLTKQNALKYKLVHDNIVFYRCFCKFYDPQIQYLINLALYYKNNHTLPDLYIKEGGHNSSKIIQILDIINSFIITKDKEAMDIEMEKAKKAGNK